LVQRLGQKAFSGGNSGKSLPRVSLPSLHMYCQEQAGETKGRGERETNNREEGGYGKTYHSCRLMIQRTEKGRKHKSPADHWKTNHIEWGMADRHHRLGANTRTIGTLGNRHSGVGPFLYPPRQKFHHQQKKAPSRKMGHCQ